ncbi:hypothetical protein BOTCAL_0750g00010 [Botryotinia calthae]|uniref:Rhodopsin domain-containing protein n=1 Tax=Botryotinia calthae TaxID=38488 RepID=A0A4Y8CJ45_9HELO|nr:hypothetical protein BOTCAL_0750g00010 [Botryotinia calthae]
MSLSETYQGSLALGGCMLGLSTVSVALRFYSRLKQKAPLKTDDWLMIPILLLVAGSAGCTFYGVTHKVLGYPTPKDPLVVAESAATLSKVIPMGGKSQHPLALSANSCVFTSALFFYHRIFCVHGRGDVFRALIIVSISVVILWTITYDLLSGLQCGTHFSALWTSAANYEKYCEKTSYPFLLSLTISDFLLDLWTICLPIPKIWGLKASLSRRLGVIGVFLLALVSFGANIARLVVYVQIEKAKSGGIDAAAGIDVRLVNTKALYLSLLEVGVACIAVNLPSMWFLISHVTPEAVIRSLRSVVSLRSLRSNRSDDSSKDKNARSSNYPWNGQKVDSSPSASESRLAPADPTETHVMYDLESYMAQPPQENVRVVKAVSQHSQHT